MVRSSCVSSTNHCSLLLLLPQPDVAKYVKLYFVTGFSQDDVRLGFNSYFDWKNTDKATIGVLTISLPLPPPPPPSEFCLKANVILTLSPRSIASYFKITETKPLVFEFDLLFLIRFTFINKSNITNELIDWWNWHFYSRLVSNSPINIFTNIFWLI